MSRKLYLCRQGYSLVELMVVVAIMGILVAVAVPSYINHVRRTRQVEGHHHLMDIKVAEEKYYALEDQYYAGTPATGVTPADATFRGMLSFDITDTTMFRFVITTTPVVAPAVPNQDFTATSSNDLNGDTVRTDCWSITNTTDNPTKITAGGACAQDGEGLHFSLFN